VLGDVSIGVIAQPELTPSVIIPRLNNRLPAHIRWNSG
jgi:hypothetical protein